MAQLEMIVGEHYELRNGQVAKLEQYNNRSVNTHTYPYSVETNGFISTLDDRGLVYAPDECSDGDREEDRFDIVAHIPLSDSRHPNYVHSDVTPVATQQENAATTLELTAEQSASLVEVLKADRHGTSCLLPLRKQLEASDPRTRIAKWFESTGSVSLHPYSTIMGTILDNVSGLRALLESIDE